MISSCDVYILINALGAFVTFLAVQSIWFRSVKRHAVLEKLITTFVVATVLYFFGFGMFFVFSKGYSSCLPYEIILIVVFSLALHGMASFCYVLCIFGPYESSVRIRLVRELFEHFPDGVMWEELLTQYNDEHVLRYRLQRLKYSGELELEGERYIAGRKVNIFSVFHYVSVFLKKLYGVE